MKQARSTLEVFADPIGRNALALGFGDEVLGVRYPPVPADSATSDSCAASGEAGALLDLLRRG